MASILPISVLRLALLVGLALLGPASARADDSPRELVRPGYGLAMTGAYLAAPLLGVGAGALIDPRFGLGVFIVTPPIMHIAYDDSSWALLSFVGPSLSIATWSYLFYLGQGQCHSSGFNVGSCLEAPVLGALFGYLAWATFDVAMSQSRSNSSITVVPSDRGASLVAYGTF
jgi:hypothetical protein